MSGQSHSLGPVAAKLTRPPPPAPSFALDTSATFADGLRRRLTIVCAPAGYGKSTATAAATVRLGADCVWYKLDVLDRDPVLFLASLTEALRTRTPEFGEPIRERLRSAGTEPFPLSHLQAMFVRECETHLGGQALRLVLDDFHEAAESAPPPPPSTTSSANLPPRLRFVVVTRYDPALRLAKLRLEDQVTTIDTSRAPLQRRAGAHRPRGAHGVRPAPRLVRQLVDIAEGWPVTIVLAGLVLDWAPPT